MHETKWLPVVPTRALHQEESGGARRLRAPETASPSRSQILLLCVRADGVFLSYHLKNQASAHPSQINKAPLAHYCTRPSHGRGRLVRKTRQRPRGWEAANIKKGWPYYKRERCFSFSFFPSAGVSTWGRKGDNGSLMCFIYSFRWCLFIIQ